MWACSNSAGYPTKRDRMSLLEFLDPTNPLTAPCAVQPKAWHTQ